MDKFIEELGSWYAVRLSSFDELELEKTKKMLQPYKYILSEEGDGITTKYHQHIVWVFNGTTDDIRKIIKDTYPKCIGNKCLYIKAGRDKTQLAKYTVKEGKFCFNGFTQKYIDEVFKTSSAKTDLKKEITDNEDDYILGRKTLDEFTEEYILIKARHDQPLYMNHIEAYIRRVHVKKNPKFSQNIARQIVDKIVNN